MRLGFILVCFGILALEVLIGITLSSPVMGAVWLGMTMVVLLLGFGHYRFWPLLFIGTLPLTFNISNTPLDVGVIFLLLFGAAFCLYFVINPHTKLLPSKIDVPVVLFLIWTMMAVLWSSSVIEGAGVCARIVMNAVGAALVYQVCRSRGFVNKMLVVWYLGSVLFTVLAICEAVLMTDSTLAERLTGGGREEYAEYLVIAMSWGLGIILSPGFSKRGRVILGVLFIIPVMGLGMSLTRSAWLGFAGASTVIFLLIKRYRMLFVSLGFVVATIAVSVLLTQDFELARAVQYRLSQGFTGVSERAELAESAVDVFARSYGLGGGTYCTSFSRGESMEEIEKGETAQAINLFATVLGRWGVIGFVLLLSIFLIVASQLRNALRKNRGGGYEGVCVGGLAALAGFVLKAGVGGCEAWSRNMWILLGMAMAVSRVYLLDDESEEDVMEAFR